MREPPPPPQKVLRRFSVMANVRGGISYSRSRRRPRSSGVERGESSVSRKRARYPELPRRVPLRYYTDDDDDDDENNDVVDVDGSHHRHDDDDDDDRQEEEQQSGSEDEGDDVESSASGSAADDVVDAGGGVEEQPPPAEEEYSDDDRPIRVVSRARTLVRPGSTSTAPTSAPAAAAPAESSPPAPSSSDSSSVIRDVTVENPSAFDCTICYLPLKSSIFQCKVGHVVCSPCHDKLGQATNCHVCRVPLPDGYFRCNAMEQVMDSIRFPCPHAGCAVKPAYHDRDAHTRTCAHKPCHCPGEGCGFAGSIRATLLEHFASVHGWPCSAGRTTGTRGFDVSLRKGFNVVVIVAGADQGIITTTTEQQYTLVLNVEQAAPVCNTIIAFCIHPRNTGTVRLGLSYYRRDSDLCSTYLQSSQIVCTDLSNGMPAPSRCFPFLVPSPGGEDDDDIRVTVTYIRGT